MKAITTKYIGATPHKPARIVASDQDGNRATVPADGDFPHDMPHRAAAIALCHKMHWPGADTLIAGSIKGGLVFVFAERNAS